MSGYDYISKSSTRCVHFNFSSYPDSEELEILYSFECLGGLCIRFSYSPSAYGLVIEHIGSLLGDINGDFGNSNFASVVDDMITMSSKYDAMAIVIANCTEAFIKKDRSVFELIDAFLLQKSHWYSNNKPCNLIFHI